MIYRQLDEQARALLPKPQHGGVLCYIRRV
jgi:hypothetical protein